MKPRNHRKSVRGRGARRRFDDLTTIKGIGESLERWFREQLDVCSFSQLAELSIDEVETLAREHGRSISHEKIKDILGQAALLASQPGSNADCDAESIPDNEPTTIQPTARVDGCWREYASFMVYFERTSTANFETASQPIADSTTRTVVHHLESGEQVVWEGMAIAETFAWIDQRLQTQSTVDAGGRRVALPAIPATSNIAIDEIRIVQAEDDPNLCFTSRPGKPRASTVRSGTSFCIEVGCVLSRPRDQLGFDMRSLKVELFAHRLDVPGKISLGLAKWIGSDNQGSQYDAILPSAVLEPGIYRIACLASHEAHVAPLSFLRGPLLQAR